MTRRQTFAVDWFSEHIPRWQKYLSEYVGRDGVKALMVGVYEGRCLSWLLDHVLTGRGASAVVVEGFDYDPCVYYKSRPVWNPMVRERFEANVLHHPTYADRTRLYSGTLRKLSARADQQKVYDIIYIDARSAMHALDSLVSAFPLLGDGGMFIVQNYANNVEHDNACPAKGIDAFLSTYSDSLRVVSPTFHLFAQRVPFPTGQGPKKKACHIQGYQVPKDDLPVCKEQKNQDKKKTK